jgi:diguanylate cyclase (GGDEF)-like protein
VNDLLLQVIVIAVVANIVLVVLALVVPRLRRSSRGSGPPPMSPVLATSLADASTHGLDADPYGSVARPEPAHPDPGGPPWVEPVAPMAAHDAPGPAAGVASQGATESARSDVRPDVRPDARFDPVTSLPTGIPWEEALRQEHLRHARYGHPVTVIVLELDRLDALAERIGRDNADRLIPPVAAVLRGQARGPDIIARTGRTRFQVLLPETDEISAINYIERVRQASDVWLEAAAISVRLSIGWASPTGGGSLLDAVALAEQRMNADRARAAQVRVPDGESPGSALRSPDDGLAFEPPSTNGAGPVGTNGSGPAASEPLHESESSLR